MLLTRTALLAGLLALATGARANVPVSLSGSPESMERQNRIAVQSGYAFLRTPADVRRAVKEGELVQLRGDEHFTLKRSVEGVARPEVGIFLEWFAADYRERCGERLVVTSLTRPRTRQPRNAHPLSVHPAGMAIDLRVPRAARCRRVLETSLLELERSGVLDITRERAPAHYHVALFPRPFIAHVGLDRAAHPEVVAPPAVPSVAEPVALQPLSR